MADVSRVREVKSLVGFLGIDELHEVNRYLVQRIKDERTFQAKQVKAQLRVGNTVSFENRGVVIKGTVAAIKRKFAHVNDGLNTWRVPMNVLDIQDES